MPSQRVLNAMVFLLGLVPVSCAPALHLHTSVARPDEGTARIRFIPELERARLREDREFPCRMMR